MISQVLSVYLRPVTRCLPGSTREPWLIHDETASFQLVWAGSLPTGRDYNWLPAGVHLVWVGFTALSDAISLTCRYDQGVFSGIIGNENFRTQFGNPNTGLEGIIVSIYNLGCFTGCIFAFLFCERTGRRLAMWIAMGFIIVSHDVQNWSDMS
jgi:MFS family permease